MKAERFLMTNIPIEELKLVFKDMLDERDKMLMAEIDALRRDSGNRLIGVKEVCEKLGVTRQTLVNLEKREELMPIRIGSKVRYKESAIVSYLTDKQECNY